MSVMIAWCLFHTLSLFLAWSVTICMPSSLSLLILSTIAWYAWGLNHHHLCSPYSFAPLMFKWELRPFDITPLLCWACTHRSFSLVIHYDVFWKLEMKKKKQIMIQKDKLMEWYYRRVFEFAASSSWPFWSWVFEGCIT